MTSFLNNGWYVAAWDEALAPGAMLSRTILGTRIVLWKNTDGEAVAMEDRCPHRLAPLSRGRVDGDRIVCGYHGLAFDCDGACVFNPHGDGRIPRAANVRRFPLVGKHRALWIWMGNADPDPTLIPDFSVLDTAEGAAALRRDHMVMPGPWDLITDNLLDLSHVNFLHDGILGNSEMIADKNEVEVADGNITVTRRSFGVTPPSMFDMLYKGDGKPADSWMSMRWSPPSAMLLDVGITAPGRPRSNGTGYFGIHLLTPETERTTHYHFAGVRWNIGANTASDEMREKVSDLRRFAFAEQDMPMIAGQADVWHVAGPDYKRPVWLDIDVGVARWRKAVADQLAKEADS